MQFLYLQQLNFFLTVLVTTSRHDLESKLTKDLVGSKLFTL